MKIVVTGNMGCGKSTAVEEMLRLMPTYALFDYDREVHKLYADPTVQSQLMDEFQTSVRSEVAALVYSDPQKMSDLNAIFTKEMAARINTAIQTQPRVIFDAPMFFEFRSIFPFDPDLVLCVAAEEAMQMERVKKRSGFTEEKIRSVLGQQLPQIEKIKRADHTFWNLGEPAVLKEAVASYVCGNNLRK